MLYTYVNCCVTAPSPAFKGNILTEPHIRRNHISGGRLVPTRPVMRRRTVTCFTVYPFCHIFRLNSIKVKLNNIQQICPVSFRGTENRNKAQRNEIEEFRDKFDQNYLEEALVSQRQCVDGFCLNLFYMCRDCILGFLYYNMHIF